VAGTTGVKQGTMDVVASGARCLVEGRGETPRRRKRGRRGAASRRSVNADRAQMYSMDGAISTRTVVVLCRCGARVGGAKSAARTSARVIVETTGAGLPALDVRPNEVLGKVRPGHVVEEAVLGCREVTRVFRRYLISVVQR